MNQITINKIKKPKIGLGMLVGLTALMISVGPALAVFPPEFDRALVPDRAYDAVREHNPNFKEAGTYAPDEIVVKFKGDIELFRVIKVPEGRVGEKITEYLKRKDVIYAEPNYIAHTFMIPNDPYYSLQWHLDNSVNGGIHTEAAWDGSTGSGVVVAVVDTGIAYESYRNPRTGKRYYQAPDLAKTCFVAGYDFVEGDTHPNDDNSHGTHVAGTVAQSTNNKLGVAGVAFGACLMPVKVLDKNGNGTYSAVAEGIRFAADNDARVINLSLGGSSPSQVLLDAVTYAYNKDVTVVAAAGNDGKNQIAYPAAYNDYVIAVGATRYNETLAAYSNYGNSLDLVAPGGDLNVDQNGDGYGDGVLQNTFNPNTKRTDDFGYWFFQGTSMATPHVAGTAALVIAKGNAVNPDDVRTALQSTAENLGPAGWDPTYGWGLVNAAAAFNWAATPNNPPVADNQSVTTPEDTPLAIALTAVDPDGDPLSYTIASSPVNGILSGSAPNVIYTSNANYNGSDGFTFKANDGRADSNIATISITITPVNDPPVADAQSVSTQIDIPVTITLSGSDIDGDTLSFGIVGNPTNGTLNLDSNFSVNGKLTYTPNVGYAGLDSFTFKVNDGIVDSNIAAVSVTVNPATPAMHVGDIAFSADIRSWGRWGSWCKVTASVLIADTSDTGVEGANISGSWSGAYTFNVSGTTNSAGSVSFQTGWVKGCGTFTFTVNDVTKNGWVYDPAANVETSDSIALP